MGPGTARRLQNRKQMPSTSTDIHHTGLRRFRNDDTCFVQVISFAPSDGSNHQ